RWPPVSFVAIRSSVVLSVLAALNLSSPSSSLPNPAGVCQRERTGFWAGRTSALTGERSDQFRGGAAAVDQVAHVSLGAPKRLQRRHPLQGVVPGDVEDHRVPG